MFLLVFSLVFVARGILISVDVIRVMNRRRLVLNISTGSCVSHGTQLPFLGYACRCQKS